MSCQISHVVNNDWSSSLSLPTSSTNARSHAVSHKKTALSTTAPPPAEPVVPAPDTTEPTSPTQVPVEPFPLTNPHKRGDDCPEPMCPKCPTT